MTKLAEHYKNYFAEQNGEQKTVSKEDKAIYKKYKKEGKSFLIRGIADLALGIGFGLATWGLVSNSIEMTNNKKEAELKLAEVMEEKQNEGFSTEEIQHYTEEYRKAAESTNTAESDMIGLATIHGAFALMSFMFAASHLDESKISYDCASCYAKYGE